MALDKSERGRSRLLLLGCAGIFLFNFVLKLLHVNNRAVCLDEPFSIFFAQLPPFELSQELMKGNTPPLYELLLHYWNTVFGISPLAVRFPSILASSVTAIVLFLSGRRFFNATAGWLAAGLFSLSTFQFHYANEARMYAIFTMLAAISVHFYLCLFEQPKSRRYLIYFTLANTLLIYIHYTGFLLIAAEGLIAVIYLKRSKIFISFLISAAISAVLFIPMLGSFLSRSKALAAGDTWMAAPGGLDVFFMMLHNFTHGWEIESLFLFIAIAGVVMHLVFESSNLPRLFNAYKLQILWIMFILLFAGMFFISRIVPVFYDRYLLFATIPLYLAVGATFYYLFSAFTMRQFAFIPALILFIAYIGHSDLDPEGLYERPIDQAVNKVKEIKESDGDICTVIYPFWADKAFGYHYSKDIFSDFRNFHERLNAELIYPVWAVNQADSACRTAGKVIYLRDELALADTSSDPLYLHLKIDGRVKESYFYPPCTHIFLFEKLRSAL